MAHQELEEGELPGGQLNWGVAPPDLVGLEIENEVGHLQPVGMAVLLLPPHERPQPGEELFEGERLGQVIVGASVEAGDAVMDLTARGEHDDRRLNAVLAEPAADLHAVLLGNHEIEDDGVIARRFGKLLGPLTVGRDVDGIALVLQELLEQRRELALVLDKEEVHRGVPQV